MIPAEYGTFPWRIPFNVFSTLAQSIFFGKEDSLGYKKGEREEFLDAQKKIQEQLKEKSFLPLYLLYGEEDYLLSYYKKAFSQAFSENEGINCMVVEELPPTDELISAVETLPFFAPYRLMVFQGKSSGRKKLSEDFIQYLKNSPKETVLLFIEEKEDKRSSLYKVVKERGLCLACMEQDQAFLQRFALQQLKKEGKKIRENAFENRYGKPVPVIAFSSNMLPGIRQKYVNTSFDAYLTKPVDGNELEKTLYTFLPENLIRKRTNEEYFQTELKKHAIVEKEEEEKTLDRSTGLQYCMQDEEVYREILGLFRDSSDEKMQELEKAFAEKDYSKYRLYAHGLKTTSLTVGAVKLSENAKKLEHAAKRVVDNVEKEEAEHYIAYNHEAFMALYRKTIQEAREYLQ